MAKPAADKNATPVSQPVAPVAAVADQGAATPPATDPALEAEAAAKAAEEAEAAAKAAEEAAAAKAAEAAKAAPVVRRVIFTIDAEEAQQYFKQGYLVRRMTQDGVLGYKIHMTNKINAVGAEIATATDAMFKR